MGENEKEDQVVEEAVEQTPDSGTGDEEKPATLTQKVVMTILVLYVCSLIYLVLSKHWLGVLPF